MPRIAVPVRDPHIDAPVEKRFGRAAHILLVDPDTLVWEAVANPLRKATGGAGVRVVEFLAQRQVDSVVCGQFGPNAQEALRVVGIATHTCPPGVSARQAVALAGAG